MRHWTYRLDTGSSATLSYVEPRFLKKTEQIIYPVDFCISHDCRVFFLYITVWGLDHLGRSI